MNPTGTSSRWEGHTVARPEGVKPRNGVPLIPGGATGEGRRACDSSVAKGLVDSSSARMPAAWG